MKLRADFNGLFGNVLCLSHSDTAVDDTGGTVSLVAGMVVTAFDDDVDEQGQPDELLASGTVIASPEGLRCGGSRWALQIDDRGVYNESDLKQRNSTN